MSKRFNIQKTDHCQTNVAHTLQMYTYQFSRINRRRRHFYRLCAGAKDQADASTAAINEI